MDTVLIFIDGTICDTRSRHHIGIGNPEFYERKEILTDMAVPGSVECLQELSQRYKIVYIGARPSHTLSSTKEWLALQGFPDGEICLSETQEDRIAMVMELCKKHHFAAGIGDRWDDNELHLAIGCLSIILEEFNGNWNTVRTYLLCDHHA